MKTKTKSRKWHPARRAALAVRPSVDYRSALTEATQTIAMQAGQLADARAIIRKLTAV